MTTLDTDFRIAPLSSRDWPALEALFASDAECADCWCMNHRMSPAAVVTGELARQALRQRVLGDEVQGLLAWSGERAVGWCGLERRAELTGHDAALGAASLEAYPTAPLPPRPDQPPQAIFDFAGPWKLYLEAGFVPGERINAAYTRVTRRLGPAADQA